MSFTALFAQLRSGNTSTFARPATALSRLTFFAATAGMMAASSWNSPSRARSGLRSRAIEIASRMRSTLGLSPEPSVE